MNSEETKKIFSNKLKMYMSINNLTQKDISEIAGVSQQSVSNWINAKLMPRMGVIETLADYFKIKKSSLIENGTPELKKKDMDTIEVPIFNTFIFENEVRLHNDFDRKMKFPTAIFPNSNGYFAQYVVGDSMVDEGINDNDMVFFEKVNSIHNGQIGCFRINNGRIIVGKYYSNKNNIIIQPCNTRYPPIIIDQSNYDDFEILGSATLTVHNMR